MSLLKYYLEREISPVHYLASNLNEHLERRQSLYNMLGMPGLLFRGKRVLEIAAGSGQNSLYIAAQNPSRYVIVEPNPVALKQIEAAYASFNLQCTCPDIEPVTLENYKADETFDIVICEGWLGSSAHERALIRTIADRVASGGMMVLTALSICGWLSNLIRYALTQKLLANREEDYDIQVKIILDAFSPHLQTISGMTRRHEDWVKDNMVNPTYLDQGLTLEMILEEVAPCGFTVFGASPDFITEWRWFKQIYNDNTRTNENTLACYEQCSHNFLDYRRTFNDREVELNRQLNALSNKLLYALSESKTKKPKELKQAYFTRITHLIKQISDNIKDLAGDLNAAIEEAIQMLQAHDLTPPALAAMQNYKYWFGRETLYFSFLRN